MLAHLREGYQQTINEVVVSGMVGPRGDGYRPAQLMEPDEAAAYHTPQVASFADGNADMITA